MTFAVNFPFFSIVGSLIFAVVIFAFHKRREVCRWLAYSLVGLTCLLSLGTLIHTLSVGESFTYMMGHFPAPWGNEIRAGVLESLLGLAFGVVLILALAGGQKFIEQQITADKHYLYYLMTALVNTAFLAIIYTNDIFTGYVFVEILTLSSCAILMAKPGGRPAAAATRYMIFSLMGSGLFLIGIIMLYDVTGHLLMVNLHETIEALWAEGTYRTPLLVVICLMTGGLAIKSGLFPFHFWMPDTYGTATPASSGILSGIVAKAYIFLLIKIIYRVIGTDIYYATGAQNLLFILGICGMIIGSISAIRSRKLSRMIANSSAAQIGYIYMGIGLGPAGVVASVFHMLTHAVTKPALFLGGAELASVSGGKGNFIAIRGSARRSNSAGALFTVGALSITGVPLFMGFISKMLFAEASIGHPYKILFAMSALAVSTILNAMYFLRTVINIWTPAGSPPAGGQPHTPTPVSYKVTAAVFAAINVALGIYAQPVINMITQGLGML